MPALAVGLIKGPLPGSLPSVAEAGFRPGCGPRQRHVAAVCKARTEAR